LSWKEGSRLVHDAVHSLRKGKEICEVTIVPRLRASAVRRSGSQLFKLKRRSLIQQNMARVRREKIASDGMLSAIERFFSGKRGGFSAL
jgi:hypothetical protein